MQDLASRPTLRHTSIGELSGKALKSVGELSAAVNLIEKLQGAEV